jgi:hypothetical protein
LLYLHVLTSLFHRELELFTPDLLYMDVHNNEEYKAAVELLVCTVVAGVFSAVPRLQ